MTLPKKEFAIQYCKDWMFEKRDDIDVNGKLKSCVLVLIGLVEESEEEFEVSEITVMYLEEAKDQVKGDLLGALAIDDIDEFLKLSCAYLEMMRIIEKAKSMFTTPVDDDAPAFSFREVCQDAETVDGDIAETLEQDANPDQDSEPEPGADLDQQQDNPEPDAVKEPATSATDLIRGMKLTVRDGVDVTGLRNTLQVPFERALALRGDGLFIYRTQLVTVLDRYYQGVGTANPKKKADNVVRTMREKGLIDLYQGEPDA